MNNEIENKLNYLLETKVIIRKAIADAGADITNNTPFREYAKCIEGLSAGGSGGDNAADLQYMQFQNQMDVHISGTAKVLTMAELTVIYNICQKYIKRHLQEGNNE